MRKKRPLVKNKINKRYTVISLTVVVLLLLGIISLFSLKGNLSGKADTLPLSIISFTAIPSTITLGGSSDLDWHSTTTSYCQGTGGLPGETPSLATGSRWTWGPAPNRVGTSTASNPGYRALVRPSTTTTYTLECFDASGSSVTRTVTVRVQVPQRIGMSITANGQTISAPSSTPLLISAGDPVQVTWDVRDYGGGSGSVQYCGPYDGTGGTGPGGANHWQNLPFVYYGTGTFTANPTENTDFSIQCLANAGGQSRETLSIKILPQIASFSAIPSTITPGGSSDLDWHSTTTSYCQGTGGLPGETPSLATGSRWTWGPAPNRVGTSTASNPGYRALVRPSTTTTYTLECFDASGRSTSAKATVSVVPSLSISSFTFTKEVYYSSSNKVKGKLSWITQGASDCTMQGGSYTGTPVPITARNVVISAQPGTKYTLSCRSFSGRITSSTVEVKR